MTPYVALLRAVNVSGTGMLPMATLRSFGEDCGFADVRTFIASGNLLFRSDAGEAVARDALAQRVAGFFAEVAHHKGHHRSAAQAFIAQLKIRGQDGAVALLPATKATSTPCGRAGCELSKVTGAIPLSLEAWPLRPCLRQNGLS